MTKLMILCITSRSAQPYYILEEIQIRKYMKQLEYIHYQILPKTYVLFI